jgi:hypothetical protein
VVRVRPGVREPGRHRRPADRPVLQDIVPVDGSAFSRPTAPTCPLSARRLTGPKHFSGAVNFVNNSADFDPPVHDSSASSSRLLVQSGGPTSNTCSPASRAVKTKSISSSRSISADDSSARAVVNLARRVRVRAGAV